MSNFVHYFLLITLVPLFTLSNLPSQQKLLANSNPATLKQFNKATSTKVPDEKFLSRLDEIEDSSLKEHYINTVQEFSRIPTEQPKYQPIVDEMLQHQDKVFEMLGSCDSDRAEEIRLSQFHQVAENQYIFQRVCFLAAYNISYTFYLYSETPEGIEVKPLNLVTYTEGKSGKLLKEESNTLVGFSNFDEQTKELSTNTKYRGVGDCGTTGKYKFENGQLVLQEFSADFKCDGTLRYRQVYP
jgi:hypothetical protein